MALTPRQVAEQIAAGVNAVAGPVSANAVDVWEQVAIPLLSGASLLLAHAHITVTTEGQTVFTLPAIPNDVNQTQLFVNGEKVDYGVEYTISAGTVLTWLNFEYELSPTDKLTIYYF